MFAGRGNTRPGILSSYDVGRPQNLGEKISDLVERDGGAWSNNGDHNA
jgi:hypothetical protein